MKSRVIVALTLFTLGLTGVIDWIVFSTKKENEISKLICNSTNINVLKKEIQKCQVLCSYCHKRKTAREFNHWKYVKSISESSHNSKAS